MSENLLGRAGGEIVGRVGEVADFTAGLILKAMGQSRPNQDEVRNRLGEMTVPEETFLPDPPEQKYTVKLSDGSVLELTSANTTVKTFDSAPELDHVLITHQSSSGETTRYRFYENPRLIAGLLDSGFPLSSLKRALPNHRKNYADWFVRTQQPSNAVETTIDEILSGAHSKK
ncbi:hypothetical protein KY385_01430 [Candidatus Parcubacteria bacterium]|nr:hypothetical protein [Candidatus Parcubacteria bacterium]